VNQKNTQSGKVLLTKLTHIKLLKIIDFSKYLALFSIFIDGKGPNAKLLPHSGLHKVARGQ
jgi:hypothetical protein